MNQQKNKKKKKKIDYHQAKKSILAKLMIGGTKNTDLTSATNKAALFIIAIAYLILLNRQRKMIAQTPAKANTA